ncbi:MAG: galactose-1-phosphate uridylyltransferase [Planctomycetes bacterium]|nr:galactose-1-phosphate uridylyltransferase [Planctomycetota bacterium]
MPELRRDPVLGRWVIVAHERAKRPSDFPVELQRKSPDFCPFCEGNESKTPNEIYAVRTRDSKPNTPGWKVRVVPNKFPALGIEGDLDKRGHGIYDRMNGIGAHEVIIESPSHNISLTELSETHIEDVYLTYLNRVKDLDRDHRMICPMIFKNVGFTAGATLEHTHSQIIATPVVPRTVLQEMEGARRFYDYRGRCLFCDIIAQEKDEGVRLVEENDSFVSFCPYASRFPFETWVLPRNHQARFDKESPALMRDLAGLMRRTLLRLERALNLPPYNYMIHTTPFDNQDVEYYHWHIEIIPRLTKVAGFEWGTGFYINPVPPEAAGTFLREVDI